MKAKRPPLVLQIEFGEQLANLLAAGFTIEASLRYFKATRVKHAAVFAELERALGEGDELDVALQNAGFDEIFVIQSRLAKSHGNLVVALKAASTYLLFQVSSRGKIFQQLAYPLVLVVLLVILQASLALNLLPGATGNLSLGGQFAVWFVGIILTCSFFVLWRTLSTNQRFLLARRIPGVAAIVSRYYQLQFLTGLTAFLNAGQPLSDYAAQLASLPNGVLQQAARRMVSKLASGIALEQALAEPVVAPAVRELLQIGQTPDFLAAGMQLLSERMLTELERKVQRFVNLIQPAFFLLIAAQIVWLYQQVLASLYGGI